MHKNKHYNWTDEKYRTEIKKFFTCKILRRANGTEETGYNFSEEFYTKYELTFFTLIYNTKKVNEKEKLGLYHTQTREETKFLEEIFRTKINKKNLEDFFRDKAVQALWSSPNQSIGNQDKAGFVNSANLRDLVKNCSSTERDLVFSLFEKSAE